MEEKLSGIVLGGVAFGENDKILSIFTLEKGIVSAKIKGVKKAGAKLKFASEPFCFIEFVFSVRSNMRTVIGASLIDSFYPIREDIAKYFSAGVVVEFIKKFYREDVGSPDAFLGAISALKEIAYGDKSCASALASYLIGAIKEAGYALEYPDCEMCKKPIEGRVFFDYRRGAFFCEACFDGVGREVSIDTLNGLDALDNGREIDRQTEIKILKLIRYYVQNRIDESLSTVEELIKIL